MQKSPRNRFCEPETRKDSPAPKTEAVVQPVAINAAIWSNGQHESQPCESPAPLPIHLSLTERTSPVSVSRESNEQSQKGMSLARDGRLLSHNPYQLLDYVVPSTPADLTRFIRRNSTLSIKRCWRTLANARCVCSRFVLGVPQYAWKVFESFLPWPELNVWCNKVARGFLTLSNLHRCRKGTKFATKIYSATRKLPSRRLMVH